MENSKILKTLLIKCRRTIFSKTLQRKI